MARPVADRVIADRYALRAPLGRGGMGVVWRAQDAVLDREVAIKEVVFPPAMADEERRPAQARVMREARAAARLNHPAAVTLFDVVQDRGGTFIVMELVDAPTLADLVRDDGPLPPERVAEVAYQVAGALEAAHRAGIVHRDVKPGNVMVPDDGPAKLADFGIASLQGDPQLTSTGLVIGSPAYMAPEQARGEESGPPVDFWALGATMFYAVEGEPPFDRGTSIATLAAVVNEPARRPRRAGALTPLITALLAKDPRSRPTGPTVRAWLNWLRVVALPYAPAELLRTQRQGRAGPLAPPSSTSASAATPAPPAVTPSAGLPQRPVQTSAFEPNQAPALEPPRSAPVQQPTRPVLPPAPAVPHRAGRRLLGLVALLLIGGMLTAWLTGAFPSNPTEDRAAPATTSANAGANPGQERAAPASTRGGAAASGTTQPAPSTTKKSATTQAPTTPTTAAAQGQLPGGWRAFTNRAGNNRVGVPPGFRTRTRQRYHATVIEEQGGARRMFTVRSQNPSAPLPQASRDPRVWARRSATGRTRPTPAARARWCSSTRRSGTAVGCTCATSTSRAGPGGTTSSSSPRPSSGTPPGTWPASLSRPSSRSADRPQSEPCTTHRGPGDRRGQNVQSLLDGRSIADAHEDLRHNLSQWQSRPPRSTSVLDALY
jgi:eukaryotic-like serine/threonine-protein kinase